MGTVGERPEEWPGELTSDLTSELRCCCPACGQDTPVAPELVGFMSRCERCGALLQVELAGPLTPVAALVTIDQVRERTAREGRIASLLAGQPATPGIAATAPVAVPLPPAPDGLASLAADRAIPPARWHAALARRRRIGAVAVAGCLMLVGLLPLLGAAVALRSVSQPPQASRAARHTPPTAEVPPAGPPSTGELLPESP